MFLAKFVVASSAVFVFGLAASVSKCHQKENVDLKTKPEEFVKYKNLPELVFQNTKLRILCKDFFKDLDGIKVFGLRNLKMEEIEPGGFNGLDSLKQLTIYGNKIPEIKTGVFNDLNVETLTLDNNAIARIDPTAFDNMKNLVDLGLRQNKLTRVDSDWFKNCPKLKLLGFDDNQISLLQSHAFKNLNKQNQLSVAIESNNLKTIESNAFDNFEDIESISLARNKHIQIAYDAFPNIKKGFQILLGHDELQCVSEDLLESFQNVQQIYFEDNPISCDCVKKIKKFTYGKKTKVYYDEAKC